MNGVYLNEGDGSRTATVVVMEDQLSLAIGRDGQNARLAAKLTGMRIDVKSETELEEQRRRLEEARTRGLAQLGEIAEIGRELAPVMVERGLGSPARVQAAGIEGLRSVGLDEGKAERVLAAVAAWLALERQEASGDLPVAASAPSLGASAGAEGGGAEGLPAGEPQEQSA